MSGKQSLKKSTVKKQQPKNPRQQFNAHCQAIKKQQQRIDNLKQQQTELLNRFQQELLPLEKNYIDTVYQKTERLLSFISKKTLAAYQRHELIQWIMGEIIYIEDYPFAEHLDTQSLRQKLNDAAPHIEGHNPQAEDLAMVREILVDQFAFVETLSDEELADMILNPDKFKTRAKQEQAVNDFDHPESEEDEQDFSFFDEEEYEDGKQEQQQKISALFGTSAANRMYKRLAMLFHPDRETDEAIKQEKHHLMIQLAQAKKNHDIWTIFTLYQQHVDPDGGFEEKELSTINPLLAEQITRLKWEYQQLVYQGDPLISMLWEKLGSDSPKAMERKFSDHAKELRRSHHDEERMCAELTSLKALKQQLLIRFEENDMDFMEMFR